MKKNTSKTNAQQDYAAKGQKLDELRMVANRASLDAVKVWKAQNPDCADLAVKPMNIAYVRRNGATTKAIIEVTRRMMYPSNKYKTQVGLLNDIQSQFPEIILHASLWQKELSARLLQRIDTIVNDSLVTRTCKALRNKTNLSCFRSGAT